MEMIKRREEPQIVANCELRHDVDISWLDEDNPGDRSNSANSMESFYRAPMFVKRSCKPELVSNTNESDLENDVEILLDRETDGTYI